MVVAGAIPSERDRTEFYMMGVEKLAAFTESWNAMAMLMLKANHDLALLFLRSFWSPWDRVSPSNYLAVLQVMNAAAGIVREGMAPVHRRAVANAKRLGRIKLG